MTTQPTPAVLRSEVGPRGSGYADRACAQRALELALPSIVAAVARQDVSGTGFLSIVVMDPGLGPRDCSVDEAILVEHDIGERAQWDADYNAYARAKARQSWSSGLDTHALQTQQAHRLRVGDIAVWGSVCLDGIVVGVSGAHPWYDEAFATMVAACIRALVKATAAAQTGMLVGPVIGQGAAPKQELRCGKKLSRDERAAPPSERFAASGE